MQRTNSINGVILTIGLAFVAMALLGVGLAVANAGVPTWLILVGRWMPALASLIALKVFPVQQSLATMWKLRPGGFRRLALSYVTALGVTLLAVVIAAVAAAALTSSAVKPLAALASAAPIVVLGPLLLVVSTIGEEVAWRGHIQTVLARRGFWTMSAIIGACWMAWHLPLQALYWHEGVLSPHEIIASTLTILAWAPLLSALVERFGSVWPAAFAHAVPLSAGNLLTDPAQPAAVWTTTIATWVVMLALAALIHRGRATITS